MGEAVATTAKLVVPVLLAAAGQTKAAPPATVTQVARGVLGSQQGSAVVQSAPTPSLPFIIAHRAGAADYPENTLLAIEQALKNRVDMIWLTVQLSSDGVPVLYRPADLSANTQATGPVNTKSFHELQQLNAGWNFERMNAPGQKTYPYRTQPLPIPSLEQALAAIPDSIPVILDMKALPAEPQTPAVARILDEKNAWKRVRIYSTDASYQQAFAGYKQAQIFETRDLTRTRLASVALAHECLAAPQADSWVAFEYRREVQLVERFTLGEAHSPVSARLWTTESVGCFRSKGKVNIVVIGVDTIEDYRAAACLGVDAVLANSPQKMRAIKSGIETPLDCSKVPSLKATQ